MEKFSVGISAISLAYLLLLCGFYKMNEIKARLSMLKDKILLLFKLKFNKTFKFSSNRRKVLAC